MNIATLRALALCFLCAAVAGGCATFSKDGGFDTVARGAETSLGKEVHWARDPLELRKLDQQVSDLLQRPLSADDAVQIALLNNGRLQASFQQLGISEADLVASGRLPNPRFTLRHASSAGREDVEETLSISVLALFTLPFAHEIEKRNFRQVQDGLVIEIVQLAARTREAYFNALGAQESTAYLAKVKDTAETGAALARRMREAGNWNQLDQAREQGFYIDASLQLTRAQGAESSARENLISLMGLSLDTQLKLAERLPDLPPQVDPLPDIDATVLNGRLDLKLMRQHIDALAASLRLGKATRFIDVLDAGPTRVRQGADSAPAENGYELSLVVPIFDAGTPRIKKSEALYAQAVAEYTQAAVEARSQVRLAYARYRTSHEAAVRERDEALPLRKSIAAQDLLLYGAAQISVFDLLADARAEIGGVVDYIQSSRDFWIARSALDTALLGRPYRP